MRKATTLSKTIAADKNKNIENARSKNAVQTDGAMDNKTTDQGAMQEKIGSSLLDKLFCDLLKDIYWVENHLVEALTTMQKAATTHELQDAFEDHRFATQKHISRLDKVFTLLGKTAEAKKCEAMEGLIKEANSMIKETKDGTMTRDVALIISAQKVEHYEIAAYGSLVQLALTLGQENIATILEKTLWEEEDTDRHLTGIAESKVNPKADEEPAQKEEKYAIAESA